MITTYSLETLERALRGTLRELEGWTERESSWYSEELSALRTLCELIADELQKMGV